MIKNRISIIACGVLALDYKRIAGEMGIEADAVFLEGGLHNKPKLLRQKLQEAIDKVSSSGGCERIIIGYGLCGNGAVGLKARSVPLVIPRVHDCIALFLGSDAEYKRQFAKYPGTYYISAGWYQEKVQPQSQKQCGAFIADKTVTHDELVSNYGKENTEEIKNFVNSWQKNYQRAAFINTAATGVGKYEQHAQEMAQLYGWKYERIEGDCELLRLSLVIDKTTDDILFVPPGNVTIYDAVSGKIASAPAHGKGGSAQSGQIVLGQDDTGRPSARFGLGIDAGGTYTDAVIYDFAANRILSKAKALTTKWNYSQGIAEAINGLSSEFLSKIDLTAVSTTLATNAIVEGQGAKVGLILMPPYGILDSDGINHHPFAVIKGRMDIDGSVLEPVDAAQVRAVVEDMIAQGVKAFAVSGYGGTVNPQHEIDVKRIIKELSACGVTCGHELSEMLNFKTRASTAVLNASIIGKVEAFIAQIKHTLAQYHIESPVVIVKGDGTLMSTKLAADKPVETILSGPAASVAGAGFLTGLKDAVVVDIGGTTTDTAAVKDGVVKIHEMGTKIAGHRTHVRALDMRTVGLGGDSSVDIIEGVIKIGPRRVAPVCWMSAAFAGAAETIDYIENNIENYRSSTSAAQMFALSGNPEHINMTKDETAIVKALSRRPYCVDELAKKIGAVWHTQLRTENLEQHNIITRCGFTPTDILHISGEFERWDYKASKRVCDLLSYIYGKSSEEFATDVRERITRKLMTEIIKKQLEQTTDADLMDDCPVCGALFENMFNGGSEGYEISVRVKYPVIGVGAPAQYFMPQAAKRLKTEVFVPENADVANAVGAISSSVYIKRTVRISVDGDAYITEGLAGAARFKDIESAHNYAVEQLADILRRAALQAGTGSRQVRITYQDLTGPAADGYEVYLGREISAEISGKPDMRLSAGV